MGIKPLAGIRVLDLTNVLAGPYACYQLALLGAEVIKIERPDGGDLARELGADPDRNAAGMGISFLAQNAQKASICLDLKSDVGRQAFLDLVPTADVVVENFRPGVMDRLGLGYETLKAIHPELIYCAISGYGQTGQRVADPAYDQIVQGVSGVMSITGDDMSAPLRVGYPLADTLGGMTAAFAISAALNERPKGAFLDVSMMDAVLSSMGWVVSNHLMTGVAPMAHGNENTTSAPSGTFATADRPINIAANRDSQWQALARHLGLDDLITDPDFANRERRKQNRHVLRAKIESVLRTDTADTWVAALNALGVPAGPVQTVPEALAETHAASRSIIANLGQGAAQISVMGSPIVWNGERPMPTQLPPALGADTDRFVPKTAKKADD